MHLCPPPQDFHTIWIFAELQQIWPLKSTFIPPPLPPFKKKNKKKNRKLMRMYAVSNKQMSCLTLVRPCPLKWAKTIHRKRKNNNNNFRINPSTVQICLLQRKHKKYKLKENSGYVYMYRVATKSVGRVRGLLYKGR